MKVETVADAAGFREFVDLPARLWPAELSVPLLESTLAGWWRGTSAHPEPVELVIVRDESGAVVGRSTVHTDARLDAKLGIRSQLFGATDFANVEAAAALFTHIERAAAVSGKEQLLGPVSLLPNQAAGVVTSGFDQRGFVDSSWNPEWVPGVYERAGFERWGEADTWLVPVGAVPVTAPSEAELAIAGITIEYGRRSRIKEQIPELLALLNKAFDQLAYYTPISPAEMAAATDGLAFLLDERLLLFARDRVAGEAVAFILVVPDITQFVQRVRGKLSFWRQLQLLATRGRYRREAILIIQGTAPARQGHGILTLLSRRLHVNLAAGGYETLRSTTVGRDNPGSARQFSRYGGAALHGSTLYRRPVSAPADQKDTR